MRHAATYALLVAARRRSSSRRCRASTASARAETLPRHDDRARRRAARSRATRVLRRLVEHPVRAQRRRLPPRHVPRARRHRRDLPGLRGRDARSASSCSATRSRRSARSIRCAARCKRKLERYVDLPRLALRDARASSCAARSSASATSCASGSTSSTTREQAARGAAARAAHACTTSRCSSRWATATGIENYSRHLSGRSAGRAAADADRLLPQGLPAGRRRVAPDGAADRRDVQRRPLAQGDAGRVRLPPAERARQPAAASSTSASSACEQAIYVSATPGDYELEQGARAWSSSRSSARPACSIPRSRCARSRSQVDDLLGEIRERVAKATSACWSRR